MIRTYMQAIAWQSAKWGFVFAAAFVAGAAVGRLVP
jgi:hypothetical protein